ncbi:hypothetical protein F5Y10DRAFT_254098 [Nemania abortiva]|nr:hypothetical protein F5Y10DRAFT_254098 [Nemania abortiva]
MTATGTKQDIYPQISSLVLNDNHSLTSAGSEDQREARSGCLQIWLFGYTWSSPGYLVRCLCLMQKTRKKKMRRPRRQQWSLDRAVQRAPHRELRLKTIKTIHRAQPKRRVLLMCKTVVIARAGKECLRVLRSQNDIATAEAYVRGQSRPTHNM